VSVLLGNGNGTFHAQRTFATGSGPGSVELSDVNGDGKPDLLVANKGSTGINTVSVLLGNGNGTFQAPHAFAAGFSSNQVAFSVVTGDVNGDGKPDLVVANYHDIPVNVSVLLGNGNGTFQAPQLVAAGPNPVSVALGDVNGDGNLDLIVANLRSNTVSVLLSNGNGTFQARQTFATGSGPLSVVLGDVNGDGKADLTVANDFSDTVSVLLGNGNGTFQAQQQFVTGPAPDSVVLGDVNGDGRPDLAVANFSGHTVTVLLNTANGDFTGQTFTIDTIDPFVVSINRAMPIGPVTNATSVSFTVTFSEPVTGVDPTDFQLAATGTVGTTLTQVTPVSASVYTVTVSGITGNGTLGLNLVDDGSIRDVAGNPLAQAKGPVVFQNQTTFATPLTSQSIAVADVNRDGKPDLVMASGDTVSVQLGNGDGTFQGQTNFAIGAMTHLVAVADVNGDGKPDIVFTWSDPLGDSGVGVLLGNGNGTFQAQTGVAITSRFSPLTAMAVEDVNGDGKPDLIFTNPGPDNFGAIVLLGNGNGTFQKPTEFITGPGVSVAVAVADINGDGKPDLVVANNLSNTVSVLLGNGDGTFQAPNAFSAGAYPKAVAVVDVNGDGKPDLVVANNRSGVGPNFNYAPGTVGVLLGNGNGTFQSQSTFIAGGQPLSLAVADLNGDGNPDLVVTSNKIFGDAGPPAGYTGPFSFVSVLLGNGDGTFQTQTFLTTTLSPTFAAVADLKVEGRPDLITTNQSAFISVFLNTANGDFTGQTYTIVGPAAPTHFVVSAPGSSTAGISVVFTVTAEDQFNETSYAYTGTVAFSSGDIAGTLPAQSTLTNGVGVFSATLTTAGLRTLTVSDTTTNSITGQSAIINVNGPSYYISTFWSTLNTSSLFVSISGDGTQWLPRPINYQLPYVPPVYRDHRLGFWNNRWYILSDTGDTQTLTNYFAVLTTDDGENWYPVGNGKIDLTSLLPGVTGCYNPTLFVDTDGTVHLLFVATTSDFSANHAYEIHVTNSATDLGQATWSQAVQLTGIGGFSFPAGESDINILKLNGSYYIIYQGPDQNIQVASSKSLTTGYTALQSENWLGLPSIRSTADPVLKLDGTGWRWFMDNRGDTPGIEFTDQLAGSGDWTTGQQPAGQFTFTPLAGANIPNIAEPRSPSVEPIPGNMQPTTTHFVFTSQVGATQNLPFVFTVTAEDEFQNPMSTYSGTVHFSSSDSAAILPVDGALTSGVGIFTCVLATAGSQSLIATDDLSHSIKGTIVIGVSAPATHFVLHNVSTTTAGLAFSVTVIAEDANNLTANGYIGTVKFSSSDTAAVLPANTTLSGGVGEFSVTLRSFGNQTLTVTDTATSSLVGTSNAITAVDATSHFVFSAPVTATAGIPFSVTVTAEDVANDAVSSFMGTVNLGSAEPTATFPASTALTNGMAVFQATAIKSGNIRITAVDQNTSTITGVVDVDIIAAPATHLAMAVRATAGAGLQIVVPVVARDAYNNLASGYSGTVQLSCSDGAALLPPASKLINGEKTFSLTLETAGTQTIEATDISTGLVLAIATTNVSPAAATHFKIITSSGGTTAGSAFVLGVIAEDPFNNTASGYSGTVHFSGTDLQAALPADGTLTSGVGFFPLILKTAGGQIITATDTVSGGITGTSNLIVVSAAPASHFAVSAALPSYPEVPLGSKSFASTGMPISFTVTALDPFGNAVPQFAGTVHLTSSDGAAILPANRAISGGTGIFSATLMTPGNQTLTVADTVSGIAGTSGPLATRGLVVTSFTPTTTGFTIKFNKPFNPQTVNLYTAGSLPDDVILATTGSQVGVRGSVVFDASDLSFTFLKTDTATATGAFNPASGLLAAGNYSLTLRSFGSGSSGFEDALGGLLDGTNSGSAGGNFRVTFSVGAAPAAVGIPDFARGFSNTDALFLSTELANGSTFNLSYTNPAANPTTATATVTFSTTPATLLSNIQATLITGGLARQIGVGPGGVPNVVVAVTNDTSTGANLLVTFQNALAQATNQLLTANSDGVSIAPATIDVANNIPGSGFPIALSGGLGVTSGSFTLRYNPSLLSITGAVSKRSGASLTLVANDTVNGIAVLSLSSAFNINATATPVTLGTLLATIPVTATANYGAMQLLHFSGVQLNGTAGPIPVTSRDAVQVAAYFGDVLGAGGPLSLLDAANIAALAGEMANTAAQTIPGFAAFPNLDPAIIGDVSLQGSVNFTDAGAMTQEIGGTQRPTIPYVPMGLQATPQLAPARSSAVVSPTPHSPAIVFPIANLVVPQQPTAFAPIVTASRWAAVGQVFAHPEAMLTAPQEEGTAESGSLIDAEFFTLKPRGRRRRGH
jgi:hypothetical protein